MKPSKDMLMSKNTSPLFASSVLAMRPAGVHKLIAGGPHAEHTRTDEMHPETPTVAVGITHAEGSIVALPEDAVLEVRHAVGLADRGPFQLDSLRKL
jgi:hypothetical protein